MVRRPLAFHKSPNSGQLTVPYAKAHNSSSHSCQRSHARRHHRLARKLDAMRLLQDGQIKIKPVLRDISSPVYIKFFVLEPQRSF
ncbi:hypothetical protein PoB_007059700 [Plakobranchus ocellatus]|uniref:Uncharacterized protein n=1 Tax=Plakobranchus ocellatus TaxID=259542 RepID=A0AAV4DJ86_9GAST|nr:hypothetical protein PoB_007059700 [Plakobranchus ocellatus]